MISLSFSILNLRQNNLSIPKITIPLHKTTLIQGQSGSGKTSFAIDTLLREGQRRILSALRFSGGDIPLVHADFPDALPTTLGIEQDADLSLGSMETLGTCTELHDQLAYLFVQHAHNHCPITNESIPITPAENVVVELIKNHAGQRISILAPLTPCSSKNYKQTLQELRIAGFARIQIGSKILDIEEAPPRPPKKWSIVIDRIKVEEKNKDRIYQGILHAYNSIHKRCGIFLYETEQISWFYKIPFSHEKEAFLAIPSLPLFRFRTPIGACSSCIGTGINNGETCSVCSGTRLHEHNTTIRWHGKSLPEILLLSVEDLHDWLENSPKSTLINEITKKTTILKELFLQHLSLHRSFDTLSTGEKSRLRLFRLLSLEIKDTLLILDEPSLGLSPQDRTDIMPSIRRLAEKNTLVIVDHSPEFLSLADHVLYFGPKGGKQGGTLLQEPQKVENFPVFSPISSQPQTILLPNDKNFSTLDKGLHIVSGRSGSGKTLLLQAIHSSLHLQKHSFFHSSHLCTGTLSGSSRSCTATLANLWTPIRNLFAQTKESLSQGYTSAQFSFNVAGGRCEACQGMGSVRIHIPPLPVQEDICHLCSGNRFDSLTLQVQFKGYNVAQILNMDIQEAKNVFNNHPKIYTVLQTLCDVGLGYLSMGQVSHTLSGGERRRLLMARLLAQAQNTTTDMNGTVFLLDEPSSALHEQDCIHILTLVNMLREEGATIICASNHPSFIACADKHTVLQ